MRIANICYNDYSNFSHNISKAIRSVGIECDSFTLTPHVFDYKDASILVGPEELKNILKDYDIVQIMHSAKNLIGYIQKHHKVTVWHTGTPYRQNKELMNSLFNPIVCASFYDSPEFENTGMKNEFFVFGCIDVEKFKHSFCKGRSFRFGHYPSNPITKGTPTINRVATELGLNYVHSTIKAGYQYQLERMNQSCDIYIELFSPTQNGKQYGSFGMTAIEAAAMGKVVVTNNSNEKLYNNTYGPCALIVCNDEVTLKKKLKMLNDSSTENIRALQQLSVNWVKNNHDYVPTGLRIMSELKKYIK